MEMFTALAEVAPKAEYFFYREQHGLCFEDATAVFVVWFQWVSAVIEAHALWGRLRELISLGWRREGLGEIE